MEWNFSKIIYSEITGRKWSGLIPKNNFQFSSSKSSMLSAQFCFLILFQEMFRIRVLSVEEEVGHTSTKASHLTFM